MFAGENVDDTVARLRASGADPVGEVAQYENKYRLCYMRGPARIIVALAEEPRSVTAFGEAVATSAPLDLIATMFLGSLRHRMLSHPSPDEPLRRSFRKFSAWGHRASASAYPVAQSPFPDIGRVGRP